MSQRIDDEGLTPSKTTTLDLPEHDKDDEYQELQEIAAVMVKAIEKAGLSDAFHANMAAYHEAEDARSKVEQSIAKSPEP